jgi:hypothetical protein
MCKHFKVAPRKGDILFIRTGVITEWDSFSDQEKREYAAQKEPKHAGIEACIATLEWLWDSGIAAVAGDAISWEVRRIDSGRLILGNRESRLIYQDPTDWISSRCILLLVKSQFTNTVSVLCLVCPV